MSKTIGPYRLNPRGDYNPAADPLYSLLDLVSDGGGSFVYINDTPSNEPTSSTSHWQQIAAQGLKGDTGDVTPEAEAARDTAIAQAALAQGYAAQLAAGTASPAGTYANLSALNAGTPTAPNTSKIYITLDDGQWCYWNGSAWVAGGVYQAAIVPSDPVIEPYYHVNEGLLSQTFNRADWVVYGGVGVSDIYHTKFGRNSIKLTNTTAGAQVQMVKTINASYESKKSQNRIWFFLHDAIDKYDHIRIDLNMSGEKYISITPSASGFVQGWNHLTISDADWGIYGGAAWSDTITTIQVKVEPKAGEIVSCTFASWNYAARSVPKILFTFDDGDPTVYTAAYPLMKAKGIPGTDYLVTARITNGSGSTAAQNDEMYKNGWDLGNHTMTHPDITNMTVDQLQAEILGASDILMGYGYTRSAYHMTFPGSEPNANGYVAMKNAGILTHRSSGQTSFYPGSVNLLSIPAQTIVWSTSLETAQGYVDEAILHGKSCFLLFHQISNGGSTYEWSVEKFSAFVDYVASKNVECVTVSTWFRGLTSPR